LGLLYAVGSLELSYIGNFPVYWEAVLPFGPVMCITPSAKKKDFVYTKVKTSKK